MTKGKVFGRSFDRPLVQAGVIREKVFFAYEQRQWDFVSQISRNLSHTFPAASVSLGSDIDREPRGFEAKTAMIGIIGSPDSGRLRQSPRIEHQPCRQPFDFLGKARFVGDCSRPPDPSLGSILQRYLPRYIECPQQADGVPAFLARVEMIGRIDLYSACSLQ